MGIHIQTHIYLHIIHTIITITHILAETNLANGNKSPLFEFGTVAVVVVVALSLRTLQTTNGKFIRRIFLYHIPHLIAVNLASLMTPPQQLLIYGILTSWHSNKCTKHVHKCTHIRIIIYMYT